MGEYELYFCIINVFGTFVVYKFLCCFLGESIWGREVQALFYAGFYVITTLTYLLLDRPFVLITVNVLGMFGLGFNHSRDCNKNAFSVLYIYSLMMIIEIATGVITGHLQFGLMQENHYQNVGGLFFNNLFAFMAALLLQNFKNMRRRVTLPKGYGLMIIVVPGVLGVVALSLFSVAEELGKIQFLGSLACILLINMVAISLYDKLILIMEGETEKALMAQQNQYYSRQLALMQETERRFAAIKHDSKNHIAALRAFLKTGAYEEAASHIEKMVPYLEGEKNHSESGNVIIDSILNFKLAEAEQRGAKVSCYTSVPEEFGFNSFDLTCILGNLLDNGIEALEQTKENFLDVYIKYEKGLLVMQIENSFDGNFVEVGTILKTRKKDSGRHGLGLENVKEALSKYEGSLTLQAEGKRFKATAILCDKTE